MNRKLAALRALSDQHVLKIPANVTDELVGFLADCGVEFSEVEENTLHAVSGALADLALRAAQAKDKEMLVTYGSISAVFSAAATEGARRAAEAHVA